MLQNDSGTHAISGIYRPGLSSLERLKKTTVGQQELFAELTTALEECAGKHSPDHTLFVGPPGIGKTHLMKLLSDKLTRSRAISSKYQLLCFPVDNYRITSFELMLLELVGILNETVKDGPWDSLLTEIEDQPVDVVKAKLLESVTEYHRKSGRRILVMFENMDLLFNKSQQNKEYVDDFSAFLPDCGPITFIGTACTFVTDKTLLKCKPYIHFNIIPIRELSLANTRKLVLNHLKFDKKSDIIATFDDLSPRIQALHDLTGGNPRLILLMYDMLIDESPRNFKSQFEDLLDRVTPYYYERIRSLSSLDRALLATLASRREAVHTQSSLAKALRVSTQQCSTAIQRLTGLGYLDSSEHPTVKRSRVYCIKEVFFDLWLAIGQLKDPRQFLPFLAEFLEKWYSDKGSREKKRQQLWYSLRISEAGEMGREIENTENLLRFLANIGDEKERCQNNLELAYHYLGTGRKKSGRKLITETRSFVKNNPVCNWVLEKLELLLKEEIANGFNQQILDLFDCWKHERVRDFDNILAQATRISSYFDQHGDHELNIAFLTDTITVLTRDSIRLPLLARIASSQEKMGHTEDAIASWEKVLELTEKTEDQKSMATTLNNLSQIYQDKGDYPMAMEYLATSLQILQKINDYDGQSTALNNIATVYFAQGYYERALEYFEKTLSIIHYTDDLPLKAITLSNISFIHKERGEFENAISDLEQSLSIMRKTGNRDGEATTLINISQLHGELGDLESCFQNVQAALKILEELRKPQAAVQALINTGSLLWQQESREMAIASWWLARKVSLEYQLNAELNEIEALMQKLDIVELSPSSAIS